MRILLIKGFSQYGGTRLFVDLAARALSQAGHAVEVLDLLDSSDARARLNAHAPGCETDLVFTISILGEYRDPEGRSISDMYRAPHVVWHVDYVLGQTARIAATPRATSLLTIDPTQIDALRATYGPEHFHHLGFFPHPAVGTAAPDESSVDEFLAKRPIELLWSGTFQKPDASWPDLAPHLRRSLKDALDLALSVEWMPPHEAVAQVFKSRGLDVADSAQRGALQLAAYVDDVIRKTRRFEFIKAVAKTGIPVHICGVGWEPQLYRFKAVTYHGAIEMAQAVQLMRQARIVLSTNVNFGAGSHERPFTASLAGAATFSDHSGYYDQAFGPGEIELYRWNDLPAAMTTLKALAADPSRCFEMARAAKARTVAEHTWDRRVDRLLEFAAEATVPASA